MSQVTEGLSLGESLWLNAMRTEVQGLPREELELAAAAADLAFWRRERLEPLPAALRARIAWDALQRLPHRRRRAAD